MCFWRLAIFPIKNDFEVNDNGLISLYRRSPLKGSGPDGLERLPWPSGPSLHMGAGAASGRGAGTALCTLVPE